MSRVTNRLWIPRIIIISTLLLILVIVKINKPKIQSYMEQHERNNSTNDKHHENEGESASVKQPVDNRQDTQGAFGAFVDVVGSGYMAWVVEVMHDPNYKPQVSQANLDSQVDHVIAKKITVANADKISSTDTQTGSDENSGSTAEDIGSADSTEKSELVREGITVGDSTSTQDELTQIAVTTSDSNVCNFDKCELHTYVYMVVPYRNRGMNLKRLAHTLAIDAAQSTLTNIHCVCMAVADYDDVVVGMTAAEALLEWREKGGSHHIQSLPGTFSRAGAMQGILRDDAKLLTTSEDESLLFVVDTDMALFPGFLDDLVQSTKLHLGYVPVCYSVNNASDWKDGLWRSGGAGMFAAYAADIRRVLGNKFPGAEKKTYGDEDWMIQHALRHYKHAHLNTTRHCNPYLWHLPHPHVIDWTATADGMSEPDGPPKVDKFGVGPYVDENISKLVDTIYREESYKHLSLSARCKTLQRKGIHWSGKFVRPVAGRRRDVADTSLWSVIHEVVLGSGDGRQ
ncbi:hypothetical protein SARC_08850 [Sphaeroforma arctica JP610]|uniref:Uncharacterized protein n=1 Tax=Sphaeroforma arctica JP610 TaxID=667725 RepID=A0A0L0FPJ6_9EUKA|nr:hypothetical protein SARC_08850 [Sphaeroforma arctica JP610]KNC78727.1 hypothetical protein SARC_08850 [Sphaeroforma arctica JP610]|eukprot:XP_014152629.1 hypothetical protein SARC_08850 [Sphaeroforma arctica JP610]